MAVVKLLPQAVAVSATHCLYQLSLGVQVSQYGRWKKWVARMLHGSENIEAQHIEGGL